MRELMGSLRGGGVPDTPLARAQDLLHEAFQARDEKSRVRVARESLAISPDCADAYVLLAEHAPSRKEALRLYEQGLAAAERTLDPSLFAEAVGHFWGILDTRPYMRARLGLAMALWTAGRREEAVQHLQDMLRLNPGDNQGVRYTLASYLLFLDRDNDLARLLQQYPTEGMAIWAYTRALLAFRQQGDTEEARQLLQKAKKANKHIPEYVLGRKYPESGSPGSYSPGAESEALVYLEDFLAGWKTTPGAVAWMRSQDEQIQKSRSQAPHPRGPLGFIKKWLKDHLRPTTDVWQADFQQMRTWIRIAGEPIRFWFVLVVSRTDNRILAHQLVTEEPSAALLWDKLVEAMRQPKGTVPHLPGELQVRSDERWQSLKPHFEEIGVPLVFSDQLDPLDGILEEGSERVGGKPPPGLLDMPGVTPELAGSFYEAAAYYYQQAPWKKVGYESAIKVQCDAVQSGPWYAVVMGQSGLAIGVAVYENLDHLRKMWATSRGDEENARRSVGTSVIFDEASDIPVADLEAAQRHGWKVARSDAYPLIFHKERGLSSRQPLAWELKLLSGCLRAIPDFVVRRPQDDPGPEEFTVPGVSGEMKMVLSWVVE